MTLDELQDLFQNFEIEIQIVCHDLGQRQEVIRFLKENCGEEVQKELVEGSYKEYLVLCKSRQHGVEYWFARRYKGNADVVIEYEEIEDEMHGRPTNDEQDEEFLSMFESMIKAV